MEKEVNELLEQLDSARKDTRVIDREKANNYYNAIADLQTQFKKQQKIIDKAVEYIKSKENGKCIHNGIEKGAYTFVLDFDKAREFIWELLEILEDKEV